ncbi:MAG: hypothetical protein HGB05_05580 [Chloroflexi bacterium]|nr:hypothetical protein [Chloroflexota bacterium]
MTIPQLTVKLGEVLNAELFRQYDEDIRNFLVFQHIPFDPDHLAEAEMTHRQAKELLEELAGEHGE